ncbi:MAG: hypothetical protein WC900_07320 [Oscillospiraceae bacterium]
MNDNNSQNNNEIMVGSKKKEKKLKKISRITVWHVILYWLGAIASVIAAFYFFNQ